MVCVTEQGKCFTAYALFVISRVFSAANCRGLREKSGRPSLCSRPTSGSHFTSPSEIASLGRRRVATPITATVCYSGAIIRVCFASRAANGTRAPTNGLPVSRRSREREIASGSAADLLAAPRSAARPFSIRPFAAFYLSRGRPKGPTVYYSFKGGISRCFIWSFSVAVRAANPVCHGETPEITTAPKEEKEGSFNYWGSP